MSGTLYIVATPIGNLEDITLRALRILREEVAAIACEDTRQTQKLLNHFEVRKPLLSYHEHNEEERTRDLLERLNRGDSIALVSDAGTPLISDPGYRVVQACAAQGIATVPLPGAAAFVTALCASGLPTDQFRYIGFLPPKSAARRKLLESLAAEEATVVAYESPHRLLDALSEMAELLPHRPVVIARELTKLHEEFVRGTAADIHAVFAARPAIKGEFTILIGRGSDSAATDLDPLELVRSLEANGNSRMDAIKMAAKQLALPKREVYRLVSEAEDNS